MSMKGKPNTAQFAAQRPDRFPRRREADKAEKPLVAPAAVATQPAATPPAAEETQRYGRARVQKSSTSRKSWQTACAVKRSSAPKRRAGASRRRTS